MSKIPVFYSKLPYRWKKLIDSTIVAFRCPAHLDGQYELIIYLKRDV